MESEQTKQLSQPIDIDFERFKLGWNLILRVPERDSLLAALTKILDHAKQLSRRIDALESASRPADAGKGNPAPPPAAEQVSMPPYIEQIAYKSPEEIMNTYPHLAASSQASDDLVRRGDVVAACARWMDEVRNNPLCPTLSSRIASIPRAAAPTFADGVAAAAKLAESDPYFQHQIATAIRTIKEPTT